MNSNVLSLACKIGERVMWSDVAGRFYSGILREWDSNVAIIDVDGAEKAVEVNNEALAPRDEKDGPR